MHADRDHDAGRLDGRDREQHQVREVEAAVALQHRHAGVREADEREHDRTGGDRVRRAGAHAGRDPQEVEHGIAQRRDHERPEHPQQQVAEDRQRRDLTPRHAVVHGVGGGDVAQRGLRKAHVERAQVARQREEQRPDPEAVRAERAQDRRREHQPEHERHHTAACGVQRVGGNPPREAGIPGRRHGTRARRGGASATASGRACRAGSARTGSSAASPSPSRTWSCRRAGSARRSGAGARDPRARRSSLW